MGVSYRIKLPQLVALAVALLFVFGDAPAAAYPAATPDTDDELTEASDRPLLARRRRRRRRRRRVRRRRRRRRRAAKRRAAPKRPQPKKPAKAAKPGAPPAPGALRRGRVEFDGRLVQGQTAKSGAIYLFARKRSDLRSMVRERTSYRRSVLRTVYPSYSKRARKRAK